jgi:NMD protein affecting ribosome stability and mRNA decay
MVRERFCPKCGGPISDGRFCSACTTKEITYEPPLVQVSEFGRVYEKGRWVQFSDLDAVLIKAAKQALSEDIELSIDPFEFIPAPKTKTVVTARGIIDGNEMTFPIRLSYRQCDFGQKQKTGYYEGILQIQRPHDEVLEYIQKDLEAVGKKGIFITKTAPTKTGIDLYFTNKNYLRILGQRIINKFGGELVLNPQLFTRNHLTSKDVYRLNALVRLPEFKKGDIISYKTNKARIKKSGIHVVKITSMGKLIKGTDLVTGTVAGFELKYIKDVSILPQIETTISSVLPEMQVLDPETYQEEAVLNETVQGNYEVNDKVSIVKTPFGALIVE